VISGTSSSVGTFNVTIGVADAGSQTAQRAFSLTVQAPALSISTAALPDTVQGTAYSQTMAAAGGALPLSWSISAGTLPTGLSMSTAGSITGTSTTVGAFTFTVQVTDSAAQVATRQFTVNVTPTGLTLTTTSLPPATVNTAYSGTLAASGGVTPYTWSLVFGTLPSGVVLNSTGSISGTPTVTGTFNITVQVQDSAAQTAQRALSLVVQPPPILITTNSLAVGNAGTPYSQTMTVSGGTGPYTWSLAAGALPTGISFSTAGVFSGTPTANASYPLTIRVTDSLGATTTKDFTLNIAPVFRFTITSIWGGIVNQPYSFTFTTADAPSTVTYALTAGALPPGLTLSTSTGVLSGTPTTAGRYTFTVQATSAGQTITYSNYTIISTNDTLYGANTGDPYADEGGGPNPAATLVSACGTLGIGSFRLTQSVSAATPGTTCFVIGGKTILDLNGNTVTGRITSNTTITNESVFNGLVNCNWVDNGGDAGCILFIGEANLGNTLRFHHLTVNNAAQFGRAIHVDWSPGTGVNASLSVHNLTIVVPSQPTVSRSFGVSIISKGNHVEGYSNDLTCVADANACQTIMCFGTTDCKLHHNKMTMQQNITAETGRAMILDGGVTNGEVWNNNIITNNNRAVRVRDSSNIRIHDNILGPVTAVNTAAIHLADPDAGVNDLNVTVDNNTITAQGGIVVFIRNGINAFVRNNHVICSGCSNSFATVRTGTQTELTLSDNPDILLSWPSPQIFVEGPNGKATICNSGTGFGSGIIVPIFTTPCP
jgi:hypothetical protein